MASQHKVQQATVDCEVSFFLDTWRFLSVAIQVIYIYQNATICHAINKLTAPISSWIKLLYSLSF